MILLVAALITCSWLVSEVLVTKKWLRILICSVAMLTNALIAVSLASTLSRFTMNVKATSAIKNLTQGLVLITSNVDFDAELLNNRVRFLDSMVVPTYEQFRTSEEAIESFLDEYGIPYEAKM